MKSKNTFLRIAAFMLFCILTVVFTSGCNLGSGGASNDNSGVEYTVTFNSDGGNAVSSKKVMSGNKVPIPASPEKTGYIFSGWYLGEELWVFSERTVTKDITLTAKWTEKGNKKVVNFDSDGGSLVNSVLVSPSGKVTKPQNPTKTGYTFIGWYHGNTAWNFNNAVTADITLRAKWEPTGYTVTYDLGDGAVGANNPTSYTLFDGVTAILPPERDGFNFIGWTYGNVTIPTLNATVGGGMTGDICFVANWEVRPEINTYNIIYELGGGANVAENPFSYTVGSGPITLVNPTRTHYDFIGWTYEGMTTPTMSLTLDTDSEVGDKTFTANWVAKKYTISYNLSGGVHLGNPTTYTVNDLPLSINAASKTNSHFIGWFSDSNYTNAISFISSCQDITLYAKFVTGSEGVIYEKNSAENGYIVTGYTGSDRHVYIANVYEGLPVVEIGEKAFYNLGISGITIPDTVKKIGDYAFNGCASLSNVNIPSSVEFIGSRAFGGCNSISYTEYEGVRYIGDENSPYNVVIGCEVWASSSLVLHEDTKIIYSYAFEGATKTVSIELPDGLVMLCDYALSGLSNITSISLPDTLQSIGENAFYGCTYLNYTVSEGAKYLGNESNPYLALISYTGSGDSLTVNPSTKIICPYALYGATKITKVVLPNTVIYIGERAFGGCTNLTSIDYNGNESEWSKIYIANGFSIKVNCSKQSSDT